MPPAERGCILFGKRMHPFRKEGVCVETQNFASLPCIPPCIGENKGGRGWGGILATKGSFENEGFIRKGALSLRVPNKLRLSKKEMTTIA
jgi:hypothetical protein